MNLEVLSRPEYVVFTTREYAQASGIAVASASRQLKAAAERGPLVRLTRGVWANPSHPYFHPMACVPKLIENEQGYVSFLTALHRRRVIEQIPRAIQIATTGHARQLSTPVGSYEFFHLAPKMMRQGIEWSDTRIPYRIATADKALLDTIYISLRRGRRFRSLPELDLRPVTKRRFMELLHDVDDPRIAASVRERFERIWSDGRAARADVRRIQRR
jgi:predicted transcriptional regulator of viral defense system